MAERNVDRLRPSQITQGISEGLNKEIEEVNKDLENARRRWGPFGLFRNASISVIVMHQTHLNSLRTVKSLVDGIYTVESAFENSLPNTQSNEGVDSEKENI